MRMLNGLYLQAGLMVSRTHPAATNEGWFSGRAEAAAQPAGVKSPAGLREAGNAFRRTALSGGQRLPALQRASSSVVDGLVPRLQRRHALRLLHVQLGCGQALGQRLLLGFQRLDARGQRVEFALFLVAELGARGAGRSGSASLAGCRGGGAAAAGPTRVRSRCSFQSS
jgi:hypothetical protein